MSRPDPALHSRSVDVFSLVTGLLAVGYALLSLLDVDVEPAVVWPVLLLAAGLVGLVAAVRSGRESQGD